MKTLAAVSFFLVSASLGFGQTQNTWDGFVTDTHCGTHCQRTSTMTPDRDCVRRCVKEGSKYGLWCQNKVYTLEPQSEAAKFAAENVQVIGELSEGIIRIKSITPIAVRTPQGQSR